MTMDNLNEIFSDDVLQELFPSRRADDFLKPCLVMQVRVPMILVYVLTATMSGPIHLLSTWILLNVPAAAWSVT
jgi:hypothetical protein